MTGSASPDLAERSTAVAGPAVAGPAVAVPAVLVRLAVLATVASGAVAALGVAFLTGMFAAFAIGARPDGLALGRINDVLILVAYPLIVPAALVLWRLVRPGRPLVTDIVTVIGLAGIAAITVLQALLVREVLTFDEQVGLASVALLVLGGWLVAIGWLGTRTGLLPGGVRMGLVGATYVGYPLWAMWAARRLGRGIIRPNDPSAS